SATLLGSVLGGVIGLLSGYIGGKTDLVAQRLLDILQGLPLLVLALVMSAALGPAIHNVIIAISIPIIPRAARVIRSSVLSIREMQYIEAARSLGLQHLRIAFGHILPNTIGPFIVLCTAQLASARRRAPRYARSSAPRKLTRGARGPSMNPTRQCALQAVAGRGPRRPRRAYKFEWCALQAVAGRGPRRPRRAYKFEWCALQ